MIPSRAMFRASAKRGRIDLDGGTSGVMGIMRVMCIVRVMCVVQ